jgi:hypothetical protein
MVADLPNYLARRRRTAHRQVYHTYVTTRRKFLATLFIAGLMTQLGLRREAVAPVKGYTEPREWFRLITERPPEAMAMGGTFYLFKKQWSSDGKHWYDYHPSEQDTKLHEVVPGRTVFIV